MTTNESPKTTHIIGTKISADHQLDFPYTRLPLSFFTNDLYRNLTETSKLLYTILLNFHEYSSREEADGTFTDSNGFVFVLLENKELARLLNVSHSTVQRALKGLEEAKLIERGEKVDKLRMIYLLHPEVAESTSMFYKTSTAQSTVQKSETESEDLTTLKSVVGSRIKKGVKLDSLFVRVPMFLFTNPIYQKLSAAAKLVLPIIIDLHEYSKKSRQSKQYTDKEGYPFALVSQMQIASILKINRATAKKAIEELKATNLIEEGKKIQSVTTLYLLQPEITEKDSIFHSLDLSLNPVRLVKNTHDKPKLNIVFQDALKSLKEFPIKESASHEDVVSASAVNAPASATWSKIHFSKSKRNIFLYNKTFVRPNGKRATVTNWKKPLKSNLKFKYSEESNIPHYVVSPSKNEDFTIVNTFKNKQDTCSHMNENSGMVKNELTLGAEICTEPVSFCQNTAEHQSDLSINKNTLSLLDKPLDNILDYILDQPTEIFNEQVSVYRSKPVNQNEMPLLDENNPIFINQYLKDSEKRFNSKIINALKFSHSNNCFHVYELSSLIQKAFDDVCAGKWYVGNYSKFVKANANECMELNSYFYSEDFAGENGEAGLLSPMIGEAISTAIYRALRHIAGNKNQRPVNDPSSYIYTALNKDLVDLFLQVQMQC